MSCLDFRAYIVICLVIAAASCCGCGPPPTKVHGEITYDDALLKSGGIVFESDDGVGKTYGAAIVDGHYELSGENSPPPKKFRVTIISGIPTGRKIEAGTPSPPGTMVDEIKKIRYQTTGEIVADQDNELSFHIKP